MGWTYENIMGNGDNRISRRWKTMLRDVMICCVFCVLCACDDPKMGKKIGFQNMGCKESSQLEYSELSETKATMTLFAKSKMTNQNKPQV
jgi:hypothetical protein